MAALLAILMIALALTVDLLGVGEPGFGVRQVGLLILGASMLGTLLVTGREKAAPSGSGLLSGLRRGYVTAAVFLLNTLVLFLGLNVLLALGFLLSDASGWTRPPGPRGFPANLPMSRLAQATASWRTLRVDSPLDLADADLALVYPGWDREDVRSLIAETRGRQLAYQPFSQFRERAFGGSYVNVSEHGYRKTARQGLWPMSPEAINVWMFGGSTTFGYGVADGETIASFLQGFLEEELKGRKVSVYNFGQGYYYSSQETALFYTLLLSEDLRPDFAVFVDGINEHFAEPYYSGVLSKFMDSGSLFSRPGVEALEDAGRVADRYFENRSLVTVLARKAGIEPLFVWQPNPSWNYDLRFHLFSDASPEAPAPVFGQSAYYAHVERRVRSGGHLDDETFLYLADLQAGLEEPLYVDRIHYTAAFSRRIAAKIGERMTAP